MSIKKDLRTEIATIGRDITMPVFGGVMRITDDTLLSRGGGRGLLIYDDIERDCHAYAVLQKRKMAVIAREWSVQPASNNRADLRAADLVREQLSNLAGDVPDDEVLAQVTGFDAVCLNMLDAILKGFSVGEIMWQTSGPEIVASEIRARDQRRFAFMPGTRGYKLTLKTWENLLPGVPVPPRKFIVHSFGSKNGNPYGLGLGNRLFWPTYFKRQDITFWLTFVDKFAAPTGIGKYPAGATPDDQAKLLGALSALASESGVIIPDGMAIDLLEAARSGSIDSYEKLARYMDEQISEAVLGETLSTNLRGGGSLAAAKVHNDVRLELVQADSDLLCSTLNSTLVRWICLLNCPGATPPKVWRDCTAPDDLKTKAERDGILSKDVGVEFTTTYLQREYGFQAADIRRITPPNSGSGVGIDIPSASFADGAELFQDQAILDAMAESFTAEDLQGMMADVLKPVFDLVATAKDTTAAMAALVGLFPQMDDASLQNILARLIFVADVWGRLNANK